MKKFLNILLVLSVATAVTPASAMRKVNTRSRTRKATEQHNQDKQHALVVREEEQDEIEERGEVLEEQEEKTLSLSQRAQVLLIGGVATTLAALILTYNYFSAVDCNAVVKDYCAGETVAPAALDACNGELPYVCDGGWTDTALNCLSTIR